ncbi:MAG TPA: rhamnogalacturonan acetylesterase [Steroidobacteraceae bacterium]|nr:rhamnogalacturonan acetylesterase [Steroidobacteraceae bacterium]
MSLAIALLGLTGAVVDAAEPAATPIRASKIILVGDSTVAVQGGWGSSFCAEHVTSSVACVNLARGGRSTASYIAEGSWKLALAEARTPGFVSTWILIQFGHNDQPGKPGRSTDLATEFPVNLRRYVDETRAAGAIPILITPLTRRLFGDGQLKNTLEPWAAATIRVAAEMKVPLIDLNARSSAAVQAMGLSAANEFASVPPSAEVAAASAKGNSTASPPGAAAAEVNDKAPPVAGMAQPKLSFDYTHLGRKGADYFSAMVVEELALKVPEMRPLLIP